jgi:hypothetical protein
MDLFDTAGDAPMASPATSQITAPLQFPSEPSTPTPNMGKGKKKRTSTVAQLLPPTPQPGPSLAGPAFQIPWAPTMGSRASSTSQQVASSPAPPASTLVMAKEPLPELDTEHSDWLLDVLRWSIDILKA